MYISVCPHGDIPTRETAFSGNDYILGLGLVYGNLIWLWTSVNRKSSQKYAANGHVCVYICECSLSSSLSPLQELLCPPLPFVLPQKYPIAPTHTLVTLPMSYSHNINRCLPELLLQSRNAFLSTSHNSLASQPITDLFSANQNTLHDRKEKNDGMTIIQDLVREDVIVNHINYWSCSQYWN